MLKILAKIKSGALSLFRIFTLKDFRSYFTRKHYALLSISAVLNIVNSISRLVAPAAFGKSLEMLARSEESLRFAEVEISASQLLYLSVCLTLWLRYEEDLKEILMLPFYNLIVNKMSIRLSEYAHHADLKDHLLLRNEINAGFLKIQNNCIRLIPDTIFCIYPGILDIIIGLSFSYHRYGSNIGSGFLLYTIANCFGNRILSRILQITEKNTCYENANHTFLTHEFEMLVYEETVRIHNKIAFEISKTHRNLNNLNYARNKRTVINSIFNICNSLPLVMGSFLLIYYLNLDSLRLEDIDDAVLLLTYFTAIGNNLMRLNRALFNCANALESLNSIHKIYKLSLGQISMDSIPIDFTSNHLACVTEHSPAIQFINVSFSYQEGDPILRNLNFTISPGTFVGIVGRSGSGKSTIVKLLFRLYEPNSGVIKINNIDIREIPISVLRSIMAYVPNSADLFQNESLIFNVLYGANDECLKSVSHDEIEKKVLNENADIRFNKIINDEQSSVNESLIQKEGVREYKKALHLYKDAMKEAKLEKFIENKFDCHVQMSTGQKQQLNLARGLVKHSCIFVFDELTAPLDSFSEKKILKNVKKITYKKTTLMIAHRLSTIKKADMIMVIDNGSLVEQGNHETLINKKGNYYNLCRLQYN